MARLGTEVQVRKPHFPSWSRSWWGASPACPGCLHLALHRDPCRIGPGHQCRDRPSGDGRQSPARTPARICTDLQGQFEGQSAARAFSSFQSNWIQLGSDWGPIGQAMPVLSSPTCSDLFWLVPIFLRTSRLSFVPSCPTCSHRSAKVCSRSFAPPTSPSPKPQEPCDVWSMTNKMDQNGSKWNKKAPTNLLPKLSAR